jgi:hypothetical protein
VIAVEVYRTSENLGLYDAIMVMSSEMLQCHSDNFSDYALSLGKQSQGLNTFKNNVLALSDKSKLLGANPANKTAADSTHLVKAVQSHGANHERCAALRQSLSADLNSDYSSLFNEKKYKELQAMAS